MTLIDIKNRADTSATSIGRLTSDISLIAVSKVQPNERVEAVLDQGHRVFGENKVQEAAGKWPNFRKTYSDIIVHLIGPLQTNKIKQALDVFDVIQTIDREKLAKKISTEIQKRGNSPDMLVQVNTGDEPQKAGISPSEADDFIQKCINEYQLPIIGVMAIPPFDEDPIHHFNLLKNIADRNNLPEISMGMSADFEKAIACGATMIRVGSAIFGERTYNTPTS